jgi:hypothetical protein
MLPISRYSYKLPDIWFNQESKDIIARTLKIESLDEIVDRNFSDDSDIVPVPSDLFKEDNFQLP